jgi:PAS domain S-box-containing protein
MQNRMIVRSPDMNMADIPVSGDAYSQMLRYADDLNKAYNDLKLKNRELLESEKNFRDLYQQAPIAYFSLGKEQEIDNCNSMAEFLIGYQRSELLGKNFSELCSDTPDGREKFNTIFSKFLSGESNKNDRILLLRKDGAPRWGNIIINAIAAPDQQILRSRCMVMDIHEHVEMEARLHDAKIAEAANKAKSEFLANMSHEIRTPMHGILSFANFGIKKIDSVSKEKLLYYFQQIYNSGNRLMLLLNDLLDISKIEAGKMSYQMGKSDLMQIMRLAVSEFETAAKEKELSLKIIPAEKPIVVLCDSARIGQVVRNLLSNAIKFTPEGKNIRISAEDMKDKAIVRVADQGIGVPPEETESVFDKFVQSSKTRTGAGGTGLGLAICREIVKAHGGEIWFEPNPEGSGSLFVFTIPNA